MSLKDEIKKRAKAQVAVPLAYDREHGTFTPVFPVDKTDTVAVTPAVETPASGGDLVLRFPSDVLRMLFGELYGNLPNKVPHDITITVALANTDNASGCKCKTIKTKGKKNK